MGVLSMLVTMADIHIVRESPERLDFLFVSILVPIC